MSSIPRTAKWKVCTVKIVGLKERVKENFYNAVFELPFRKSYVYGKFNKEMAKQEKEFIQELGKHWDSKKSHTLPVEGMSE